MTRDQNVGWNVIQNIPLRSSIMDNMICDVYLTNIVRLDVDSLFCMVVNRGVQAEKHFYP